MGQLRGQNSNLRVLVSAFLGGYFCRKNFLLLLFNSNFICYLLGLLPLFRDIGGFLGLSCARVRGWTCGSFPTQNILILFQKPS